MSCAHNAIYQGHGQESADPERIAGRIAAAGPDLVVNHKDTILRALPDADKARADNAATARG